MTVSPWPQHVVDILSGDLTVAFGSRTPAGGVVMTPMAPLGQHELDVGTVVTSTSIALWRKLRRIEQDDRVGLLYHAREHGRASSPHVILVQGRAAFPDRPERFWTPAVEDTWHRTFVPRKRGRFWDWIGHEYYDQRVLITITVHRLVVWHGVERAAAPEVLGAPLPTHEPGPQPPPPGGKDPRIPTRRYRRRLERSRHVLVGHVGADGFPSLHPVDVSPENDHLTITGPGLPDGARRAGVLAHWFEPKLKGQGQAVLTGWLESQAGRGRFAPHTLTGYTMPRVGDTGFTVAAGLGAKIRYQQAVKLGRIRDGAYQRSPRCVSGEVTPQ